MNKWHSYFMSYAVLGVSGLKPAHLVLCLVLGQTRIGLKSNAHRRKEVT